MYKKTYNVSDHARARLAERFPDAGLRVESLLESSVPFGSALGSDYLLLNDELGVVFAVTFDRPTGSHWVKTALTKDQACANISRFCNLSVVSDASDVRRRVEENREQASAQENTPADLQKNPADSIARYATELMASTGYLFPDLARQKEIEVELSLKLGVSRRAVKRELWPEVGRLIRELRCECV